MPITNRRRAAELLRSTVAAMHAGAMVLVLAGGWSLYLAATASTPASAATLGGTATITDPSSNPLASGGSATMFSVALPANAACSGDTSTGGYHIYSYLVTRGTDVTTVTFGTHPSVGLGFVNNVGLYYGPVNTAITTGQIIGIPTNFEWAPLLSDGETLASLLYTGGTSGVWEAGIACATSAGVLSDYWNTEVTFTASTADPNGFVWSAVPGPSSTSGTTTTTGAGGSPTTSSSTTTSTTTAAGTTATTSTTAATTSSTTTSTVAGATTTTGGSSTTTPISTSSGSSSGTGDSAVAPTTADSSSLPLTGASVQQEVAVGMLCIGSGLFVLGWSVRMRRARGLLVGTVRG